MKVEKSLYLQEKRPLLKELLDILLKDFSFASILAADSTSKRYSVSRRGTSLLEDNTWCERGFVVTVYDGKGYGEYSFTEITEELLPRLAKKIKNELMPVADLVPEGISLPECPFLEEEAQHFNESTEYIESPLELGDEKIIELLTDLSEAGRAYDERILDCTASCSYQQYSKLFLSPKKDMEQNVLLATGAIYMMAPKGEEIVDYYKSYSNLGGTEVLRSMKADLTNVADITLELLNKSAITPGLYDCICTPDVTGMIVHEAFGHGVEMDMFVKDRALARQYIDKYVASPLVTMHDGAAAAKEVASYFFDDEGTLGSDTVIIEEGILKRGISDRLTATHLGTKPTGNGRRQNTARKAYTRMTNTFFKPGNDKLEDMIASIEYGFLLDNAFSGMEDPKNWGIQCMVNVAREIKDGKLTGKIFSPIVLTGYVPDLLKSISMISGETVLGGGGYCGKGYKEWVKVSDGGPYIKAKIRLG